MIRRDFLKFLGAGLASLPFAGKLFKEAAPEIKAVAKNVARTLPKVKGMPEWFTPLVNKIMKEGKDISPKASRLEDMEIVKKLEIPVKDGKPEVIKLTENKTTGEITIESSSGGVSGAPFELNYRPPKSDINLETGKQIKNPGEFSVVENRPRPDYTDPGNYEFDYDFFNIDHAYSDVEKLEKIATGKIKDATKIEQRAAGRKKVENSPYDDIMDRYPDPDYNEFDYANGGRVRYGNGGVGLPPVNEDNNTDSYNFGQSIYTPNELFFGSVEKNQPKFQERLKNDPRIVNGQGLDYAGTKNFLKDYFRDQSPRGYGLGYGGSEYGIMGVKPFSGPDRSLAIQGYYNTDEGSKLKGMVSSREQSLDFGNGIDGFNFSANRDTYSGKPNYGFGINFNSSFKSGGYVSKGEPVNTDLTRTIPPVKGPSPQGVETLFKRRYR